MTEPTDPYRRKGKIVQHAYRDGYIVWNWEKLKWDYFGEKME